VVASLWSILAYILHCSRAYIAAAECREMEGAVPWINGWSGSSQRVTLVTTRQKVRMQASWVGPGRTSRAKTVRSGQTASVRCLQSTGVQPPTPAHILIPGIERRHRPLFRNANGRAFDGGGNGSTTAEQLDNSMTHRNGFLTRRLSRRVEGIPPNPSKRFVNTPRVQLQRPLPAWIPPGILC
jgi:hypothetical protein